MLRIIDVKLLFNFEIVFLNHVSELNSLDLILKFQIFYLNKIYHNYIEVYTSTIIKKRCLIF